MSQPHLRLDLLDLFVLDAQIGGDHLRIVAHLRGRAVRDLDAVIEHDMTVVMEISDHVVVLDHGQKIADGTPEEICNDPKVIAASLGVEEDEVDPTLGETR